MRKIILLLAALALILCGCGGAPEETTVPETEPDGTGLFTYRESVTQYPTCYSPLDWYTEADSKVLSYTAVGLYGPTLEGEDYCFQPELALKEPVDVSERYGMAGGTAWQIDLKPQACWEDGTAIDADSFLFSFRTLLEGKHYRAAALFSSALQVENAYEFYMQDRAGQTVYLSLAEAGYSSGAEALNDGHETLYLNLEAFWGLDKGWQDVRSTEQFRDEEVALGEKEDYVNPKYLYDTYLSDGAPYDAYQTTFVGIARTTIPTLSWEDVGIRKGGDHRLILLLEKPITQAGLMWELSSPFLVPQDLYGPDYGTDPDSYASFGPYKLESAESGELYFVRNDSWYGYSDGAHGGQYQADAISCRILSEDAALAAFDAGELDTVVVAEGENALSVPQTYTSKLTFNTSRTALTSREREGINKRILTYRQFRQAISLAVDRQAFVEQCVPYAQPALGLLNDTFLSDLATGERYRNSQAGQSVLAAVYGENSTGYDPVRAGQLLQAAYDAALAEGNIGEEDMVELEFLVYREEAVYSSIVSFLQEALDTAAAGTSLEGRITVVMTVDPGYYDTARTGEFDIILSTWGGSAADPFSILGCYCDREKIYEYGFDPSRQICTLMLGDTAVSRTYRGWYEEMLATGDPSLRLQILAGLEENLLVRYDCVPLYKRRVLFRDSERILRPVKQAVPLVDFGGVRYAVFTADDAGNECLP